jgi:hypothetical protein
VALLDPAGPRATLGWTGALAAPLAPAADTLFGPRGACVHPDGSLWAADTGHHRLLGWARVPEVDNAPADALFGQPDFGSEGRNAKRPVGQGTLNVPTGVCAFGAGLAVADAWNHRVLIWRAPPHGGEPPDLVLGQRDFALGEANRGADRPGATTLHWPYGVAEVDGRLVVCDAGNRRVLIWDAPAETGQPADRVLGQRDFDTRDENMGGAVSAASMRWPHGAAGWQGGLAVADAGNNRVMLWARLPEADGAPCDRVLGQADVAACDHNRAAYYPSDRALNMPYAVAVAGGRLAVADTANSRLVGFAPGAEAADRLTGQPDFAAKGDNRWGLPSRDSLCWPYGISTLGGRMAVADSGNNRVSIWEIAR